MDQAIKVALLGATGKAGQYILTSLLNKGYSVKALIRRPDTYTVSHPLLEIVQGDVKDFETTQVLIKDCGVVVAAIGPRKDEPLISSLSTMYILRSMEENGIKRFITLAGLNLDAPGDRKSEATKTKSDWMRQNFPDAVADRQKAFELLCQSNADWTMLRLPWIEQTAERCGLLINLFDSPGEKISTTDLADFVVGQIGDRTYAEKAPFLASK